MTPDLHPASDDGPDDSLGTIDPRRDAAALALVQGASVLEAANAAGVTERTLYRWLRSDPALRTRYTELRETAYEAACASLANLFHEAVMVAAKVMRETQDEDTRLKASKQLQEAFFRSRDTLQSDRLKALEEAISEQAQ